MLKKYFVAALLSFCLAVTLFSLISTSGSQAPANSSRTPIAGEPGMYDYDSWCDVNHDGVIDIADMSIEVDKFLTIGDPTLTVDIINSFSANTTNYYISAGSYQNIYVWTEGFKEITLGFYPTSGTCSIEVYWYEGKAIGGVFYLEQTFASISANTLKVLSIHGSELKLIVYNTGGYGLTFWLDYYMTT
jgi:hypothetical protein